MNWGVRRRLLRNQHSDETFSIDVSRWLLLLSYFIFINFTLSHSLSLWLPSPSPLWRWKWSRMNMLSMPARLLAPFRRVKCSSLKNSNERIAIAFAASGQGRYFYIHNRLYARVFLTTFQSNNATIALRL